MLTISSFLLLQPPTHPYRRIKNCLDPKWAEMVYYEHPEFSDGEEKDIYVEIRIYDDNRGKSEDALMSKSMVNLTKVINHPQQSLDVDLEEGGM